MISFDSVVYSFIGFVFLVRVFLHLCLSCVLIHVLLGLFSLLIVFLHISCPLIFVFSFNQSFVGSAFSS